MLQTWRALAGRGIRYRIVNLSFSGARVSDVLTRQIPALAALSATPELVTVLIGSNDIIKRDLRAKLPGNYRAMLSALPKGALVATVPRPRGVQAEVNRIVQEAEDAGAVVAVPLHFAPGARAGPLPPRRRWLRGDRHRLHHRDPRSPVTRLGELKTGVTRPS